MGITDPGWTISARIANPAEHGAVSASPTSVASLRSATDATKEQGVYLEKLELKQKYIKLHCDLAEKLVVLFPFTLDMPVDEYNGEARMILARLHEAKSPEELRDIVYEVFSQQFDAAIAEKFTGYDELVEWLWANRCRLKPDQEIDG